MSLKLRLNLVITLLLAIVMLAGAGFLLRTAPVDVRAEVASTANLAIHFLDAELGRAGFAAHGAERPRFDLPSLGEVRHLRIELYDAEGRMLESNHQGTAHSDAAAPRWFARLVGVAAPEQQDIVRDVVVEGRKVGRLVVRPDPSFEVEEVWKYASNLFQLAIVLFLATNLVVFWLVGRALAPVDKILAALTDLEKGDLTTRLPPIELPELDRVGRQFNRMMDALQSSITQNRLLTQQLIRVQEDERRSLARELHDELGQCLSAINADAMAILNAAKSGQPASPESARAIAEVARYIMDLVRGMLARLHPETLETIGLEVALRDLVKGWRQRNPGVVCTLEASGLLADLPDVVSITAYRVVQEALTNVARHAQAKHVQVLIRRGHALRSRSESVTITVRDDGLGFPVTQHAGGFGLLGMRERVEAIGGALQIGSQAGRGVLIEASLPVDTRPWEKSDGGS